MKVMLISLGCDKNLVDSEMMLGILADKGYTLTDDEDEAEVIVVNTCSFILDAKTESIQTLIDYGALKQNGILKCLACTGCLAQRYEKEIRTDIPEVDIILGTASFDRIADAIDDFFKQYNDIESKISFLDDIDSKLIYGCKRILSTGGHYAYLKIAEGCDKHCTYCAIPSFRGRYRSVPMEQLIKEAEELVREGVKELIIVAQETTVYGLDLYGKKSLHILLQKLCDIKDLEWIRLLYCYPEEIYDELIAVMSKEPKICHYIDMPIQHSENFVLQKMGRRTNRQMLEDIIKKLRDSIPDIAIRTTLITGFPGEKEEHFEAVLEFVKKMRFDRLGVFTYSAEEGTIAADMEEQISEEIKEERRDAIMQMQQEIAFENANEKIGRVMRVMVEGRVPEGALVCRSYMDAPEVDGFVFVDTDLDIMSGTFLDVSIIENNEYDLIGTIIEN